MLRKAVITGGNGYLGWRLVRTLHDGGIEVHVIAHRRVEMLQKLLPAESIHCVGSDPEAAAELVRIKAPDAIFHLASIHDASDTLEGLLATIQSGLILGAAVMHAATSCSMPPAFIHIGSYWQFGCNRERFIPNSAYAAIKRGAHDLLLYFREVKGLRALTLVPYEIFGPDDTRPKLWNDLMHARFGDELPTTGGEQLIELVHVDDVVRAVLTATSLLLNGEAPHPLYAISSQVRESLRTLLGDVNAMSGKRLRFQWGARPYGFAQIFEPWIGERLPGWQPMIDPKVALAELMRSGAPGLKPKPTDREQKNA